MMQVRRGMAAGWMAVLVSVAGTALAAWATGIGLPGQSAGQPAAKGAEKPAAGGGASESPAKATTSNPGPLLSVEFPGGSVAQFIEVLRDASGSEPVNAVVSPTAARVQLAPVRLRKVALEIAMQSIEAAAGAEAGSWKISKVRMSGQDRDPLAGESPVYSVMFIPRSQPGSPAKNSDAGGEATIQIYSMRDLTDPKPGDPPGVKLVQDSETVLSAVKIAVDLTGAEGQEPPELKYHKDSGLLIVRGTSEQANLVERTLSAMERDVRERRLSAAKAGMGGVSVADLRAQVAKANLMVQKAEGEFKHASDTLERLRSQAAAGVVSAEEVASAEAKAQNAAIDIQMAKVEFDRFAEQLRGVEGRGAASDAGPTIRAYDLSAWGPKAASAAAEVAKTLEAVSGTLEKTAAGAGKELAGSAKYDGKTGTCIVTGGPWSHELARRVLVEFARTNGLGFDGAARATPGPGPGGPGGAAKPK